jgi:hypothetical protein
MVRLRSLYPLFELLPQQAFVPNQQNRDDDQKSQGIFIGDSNIPSGQAFRNAQNDAQNETAQERQGKSRKSNPMYGTKSLAVHFPISA